MDILFDCCNTIRECISFEMNFSQKGHPAIDISVVENMLPDQYIRVLELIHDIQRWCRDFEREYDSPRQKLEDWTKVRGQFLLLSCNI